MLGWGSGSSLRLRSSNSDEQVVYDRVILCSAMHYAIMHYAMWVVSEADWSERGNYISAKHGVSPAEANDALSDPLRLVIEPDPASKSGRSVRVIGYSQAVEAVITVIVLEYEGRIHGVNAWRSNTTDLRRYRQEWEQ